MQKCAIYIRVSTQEQADSGYSIEAQKEKLTAFAQLHDFKIVDTYIDAGVSGAKYNRPELNRLKNDLKNIDVVLIYKLDRLSRSIKDTMILIEDLFKPNNIRLVSLSENFDTGTAMGMATVGMLSTFAQLERENIKERLNIGKVQAVKNGNYLTQAPIGYIVKDKKLYKDPEVKELVEYIFKRLLENISINQIAKEVQSFEINKFRKEFFTAYIYKMYNKKIYAGHTEAMGETIYNTHEAYITDEEQGKIIGMVQSRRKIRSSSTNNSYSALFRGLLLCQECGYRMSAQKATGGSIHYKCAQCHKLGLHPKSISEIKVTSAFLKYLPTTLVKLEENKEEIVEVDYQSDINKLKLKLDKIKKAWFDELITNEELKKFNNDITKELKKLYDLQELQDNKIKSVSSVGTIKEKTSNFLEVWDKLYYIEKVELLKEIIESITINVYKDGKHNNCDILRLSYCL